MATLKKEQRPDTYEDGGKVVNESIGLDNPDFHYRIVGKDPSLKDNLNASNTLPQTFSKSYCTPHFYTRYPQFYKSPIFK